MVKVSSVRLDRYRNSVIDECAAVLLRHCEGKGKRMIFTATPLRILHSLERLKSQLNNGEQK
jgi:hypothetical protein